MRAAANGCGSADTAYVPDSLPSVFSFRSACDGHDDCYGTLGASKRRCDAAFLRAMKRSCRRYSPRRRVTYRGRRLTCTGVAYVYYRAVSRLPQAQSAYDAAQREAAAARRRRASARPPPPVPPVVPNRPAILRPSPPPAPPRPAARRSP